MVYYIRNMAQRSELGNAIKGLEAIRDKAALAMALKDLADKSDYSLKLHSEEGKAEARKQLRTALKKARLILAKHNSDV